MAWLLPAGTPIKRKGRLLPCTYLLAEASAIAEEAVFEHYALSPKILKRILYDVRFLEDWPFPEEALTVLVRGESHASLPFDRRESYLLFFPYGRRIPFGRGFLPALLLYIFTHELVHMVRFALYEASYFASPKEKWIEEKKVHGKTKEILRSLAFVPGLSETLEYFDQHYEGR